MILPPTDTLILTADDDGQRLASGSTPLVIDRTQPAAGLTLTDYQQFLPSWARKGTSALRDAFLQTWATLINELWVRYSAVLEAQATPRFAEGIWLDSMGQLLGKPRTVGELDSAYRARLMLAIDVVSPTAIKAAVNAIVSSVNPNAAVPAVTWQETAVDKIYLAPETSSDPQRPYAEQQTGATPVWWAFLQPSNAFGPTNQPGPSPFQTVNQGGTFRLWANYLGPTGNKTGAFLTGTGPGVLLILNQGVFDVSQEPFTHNLSDPNLGPYDFTYGIAGGSTSNQTVIAVATASTPVPCIVTNDQVIDQLSYEIERRRAAGVGFTISYDLPASLTF